MCTYCYYFFAVFISYSFVIQTEHTDDTQVIELCFEIDFIYLVLLKTDQNCQTNYDNICFTMTHSQDVDSIIQFCINIVNYGYSAICIFFFFSHYYSCIVSSILFQLGPSFACTSCIYPGRSYFNYILFYIFFLHFFPLNSNSSYSYIVISLQIRIHECMYVFLS